MIRRQAEIRLEGRLLAMRVDRERERRIASLTTLGLGPDSNARREEDRRRQEALRLGPTGPLVEEMGDGGDSEGDDSRTVVEIDIGRGTVDADSEGSPWRRLAGIWGEGQDGDEYKMTPEEEEEYWSDEHGWDEFEDGWYMGNPDADPAEVRRSIREDKIKAARIRDLRERMFDPNSSKWEFIPERSLGEEDERLREEAFGPEWETIKEGYYEKKLRMGQVDRNFNVPRRRGWTKSWWRNKPRETIGR